MRVNLWAGIVSKILIEAHELSERLNAAGCRIPTTPKNDLGPLLIELSVDGAPMRYVQTVRQFLNHA